MYLEILNKELPLIILILTIVLAKFFNNKSLCEEKYCKVNFFYIIILYYVSFISIRLYFYELKHLIELSFFLGKIVEIMFIIITLLISYLYTKRYKFSKWFYFWNLLLFFCLILSVSTFLYFYIFVDDITILEKLLSFKYSVHKVI